VADRNRVGRLAFSVPARHVGHRDQHFGVSVGRLIDAALFANDAAPAAKRSSPTGADTSQAIRDDDIGKRTLPDVPGLDSVRSE
jgi:hypothetical protein